MHTNYHGITKVVGSIHDWMCSEPKHFRNLENNSGEGFDIAELLS
jgi:hypothetical protein